MDKKIKVKVYIDGANMFYTQKKIGWNLDWLKVKNYLEKHWNVLEIRYYTGIKEGDEKMEKYLKYLNYTGFNTISKNLKIIKIGPEHPLYKIHQYREMHKSNFDVEMTTDILIELLYGKDNPDHIKQVILFSGDSDFNYLIKKLCEYNIGTVVFASKKTLAWELKFSVSKLIKLEDIKEEIIKNNA